MQYSAITIQGNIFTSDLLEKIRSEDIRHQNPADFGLDKTTSLRDEIGIAWAAAKAHWQAFRIRRERLKENDTGTSETRQGWMLPFMRELGYDLEKSTAEMINGKSYAISHRAVNRDRFPVHIVGINQSLDTRAESGGTRVSPHALVQEYLNNHDHLYALVSNGRYLRLLRDATRLSRLSFLECDLARMMEDDLFAEFALLFRILHVTRMPERQDSGEESVIEFYHQESLASGSRIRERLSEAVEESLKLLANGLLKYSANEELRQGIKDGRLTAETFYLHLLRLVYRMLFLLVIEERHLIYPRVVSGMERSGIPESQAKGIGNFVPYSRYNKSPVASGMERSGIPKAPGTPASGNRSSFPKQRRVGEKSYFGNERSDFPKQRQLYYRFYSINRLTHLAEQRIYVDPRKTDLWRSLFTTFRIFENAYYGEKLGIKPLGSGLFAPNALGDFVSQQLDNGTLLKVLFRLVTFEDENKQRVRVNYADLDVEEFGSVYEGLLEYDAEFRDINGQPAFVFVKGEARSSSGSHYTPEELVKPLIEHSLDHLIQGCLKNPVVSGMERSEIPETSPASGNHSVASGMERSGIPEAPGKPVSGNRSSFPKQQSQTESVGNFVPHSRHNTSPVASGMERSGIPEAPGKPVSGNRSSFPKQQSQTESVGNFVPHSRHNTSPVALGMERSGFPEAPSVSGNRSSFPKQQTSVPTSGNRSSFPKQQEQALLSLKVADVACGSGHILLSAARRIGLELARVRSGEDQPSPPVIRQAIRDVIRHCIYGVDKNPLAVELCKVALWLEAHNPGEPLNFLDHRIKCGDAIVGLAHKEELKNGIANEAFKKLPGDEKEITSEFSKRNRKERKNREQFRLNFEGVVEEPLEKILAEWQQVDAMSESTPEEIESKRHAYTRMMGGEQWWKLKTLADIQTAQFFIPKTREHEALLVTDADYREYLNGSKSLRGNRAAAKAEAMAVQQRFFHYFLQFPEVFVQGGFDCVLGNPPFLGGGRISSHYGDRYLHYLHMNFEEMKGLADYVGYFFRRIFSIIKAQGFQSLIATNTIAQGDTREGGLAVILDQEGTINHAVRSMRWPGLAAVEVALVSIHKGRWNKELILDRKIVPQITSYLDDSEDLGEPYKLACNQNKSFAGSKVYGHGFVITPEEAQLLIEKKSKNQEVLFPYLDGSDLNGHPDQSPGRWVIYFRDWSEKFCRENYPDCLEIVERLVKPERMNFKSGNSLAAQDRARRWWQFERQRLKLYSTIKHFKRVLAITCHSKIFVAAFMRNDIIYSHATFIFALEKNSEFAIFSSSFHEHWAWKYSSTIRDAGIRYTPSTAFETFPFPQILTSELERIGEEYHEFRRQVMLKLQLGLTKLYNQFHNRDLRPLTDAELAACREMKKAAFAKRFGKQSWELWSHLERCFGNGAERNSRNNQDASGISSLIPEATGADSGDVLGMSSLIPEATGVDKVDVSGIRSSFPKQHAYNEAVADILHLRRLHKQMDEAVLQAYLECGNTAFTGARIELAHDFYDVDYLPENDRIRYTIHPDARKEILKRLLLLNHEIYAQEVEQGLHEKKKGGKKTRKAKAVLSHSDGVKEAPTVYGGQGELFG